MEEAKSKEFVFDLGFYYDDTTPELRDIKAERIYAAAMGVTPRLRTRSTTLDHYD